MQYVSPIQIARFNSGYILVFPTQIARGLSATLSISLRDGVRFLASLIPPGRYLHFTQDTTPVVVYRRPL
jgi:hypothetical protein